MTSPDHPTFPGIETAMDFEKVKPVLADLFSREFPHLEIVDGRVGDAKYDACLRQYVLLYHIKIWNRRIRKKRKHLVTALVFSAQAQMPESSSRRRATKNPDYWIDLPQMRVPELRMVLHPFPYDTAMPWLIDAVDPDVMKIQLNRVWSFHKLKVRKIKIHLLDFTPHMRASFLYEILIHDKARKTEQWGKYIGKTNVFKKPDRLFACAWALWQACEGTIGFPKPTGFLINPRMTFQEQIPGVRLGGIVDDPLFGDIIRETARSIARFHSLSIPLKTRRGIKEEHKTVTRWSELLVKIRPDLAGRIKTLRDHILADLADRSYMRTPVHADFHHTNILVEGTTARIIDLDEAAYGDPCVDIGRFLASLRIPSLRTFGSIHALDKERERFLCEYLNHREEDIQNIRLFESASLLTAAASAFRIQRPNWNEEVELLLNESETIYRESVGGKVHPVHIKPKVLTVNPTERTRWMKDETFMLAALTPVAAEVFGADLVNVRMSKERRHHFGHRFVYKLVGRRGKDRWKSEIEGIIFDKIDEDGIFNQVSRLNDALKAAGEKTFLPIPFSCLSYLGALFSDHLQGRPLAKLLGTPEMTPALDQLSRSLAVLHRSGVKLKKKYSVHTELAVIRRKLETMESRHPKIHGNARNLYDTLQRRADTVSSETSPILYHLKPGHILYADGGIRMVDISGIRNGHPGVDVGNLAASVIEEGLQRNMHHESLKAAADFIQSYASYAGKELSGLSFFEAAALLRLAVNRLGQKKHPKLPGLLIDIAAERMSNVS
jgi:aminoglycoside phosphotransferase (APT) family kinase protein